MTRQISAMWLAVIVALVGGSIVAAEGADPPYPTLATAETRADAAKLSALERPGKISFQDGFESQDSLKKYFQIRGLREGRVTLTTDAQLAHEGNGAIQFTSPARDGSESGVGATAWFGPDGYHRVSFRRYIKFAAELVRDRTGYDPMIKPICQTIVLSLTTALVSWAGSCMAADQPFTHPGILHSRAALDFVKLQVAAGEEPWKSAWEELRSHGISRLDWKPKPAKDVVRGPYNNPDIGGTDLMRDAAAAYSHAIQWYVTGEKPHANKAIEILDAYATTLKSVGGHDAKLLVGMVGINFANAAEIIRHTEAGWSDRDQKQFEHLLTDVFYPIIKDFYPTANGNWDAAMIQTMLAMGVFLDDRQMFQRAVDYYLDGQGNGAICNYINEFGECQESGRDQGHTQMGLGYLGCAAEIAWQQGVDLYGAYDSRLAIGYEYTAKYNLGHDVPYEPYRSHAGRYNYPAISEKSRGRFSSIYERVYHHYHDRMGQEMPFTGQVVEKIRPERWQTAYASWGTLMYAGQPVSERDEHKEDG